MKRNPEHLPIKEPAPSFDTAQLEKEIQDPGRIKEFVEYARALFPILPKQEQKKFVDDPYTFVSETFLFRGLETPAFEQLTKDRHYPTQMGAYGSTGVFMTNRPYSAFTYQHEGVIAVIDSAQLELKTRFGIVEVGSPTYIEENRKYLQLAPPTRKAEFLYSLDNRWDIQERTTSGIEKERTIVLRLPQPIECTAAFLHYHHGSVEITHA